MGLFNDLVTPQANVSRNAFDRSSREVFSAKVGQYQFVKAIHTMPNAEYEIDLQQLCRMDSVVGSPFTRLKINYEFQYIDYNHIYSGFNEFVAQREDKQLSMSPTYKEIPKFQLRPFLYFVGIAYLVDYFEVMYGFQHHQDKMPRFTYVAKNAPWLPLSFGVVRNLDMMGYVNMLPFLHACIRSINAVLSADGGSFRDQIISTWNSSDENYTTLFEKYFGCIIDNECFGDNHFYVKLPDGSDEWDTTSVNLWTPCAYNRAWYEYKRNSYYDFKFELYSQTPRYLNVFIQQFDPSNTMPITPSGAFVYNYFDRFLETHKVTEFEYVRLFNLDDLSFDLRMSGILDSNHFVDRLFSIFCVKPIPYKKDMFTGVLPSTQFGDVSVFTETDVWKNIISRVSHSGSVPYENDIINNVTKQETSYSYGILTSEHTDVQFKFDPAVAISVLSQRRADAMQRFSERMLRAGDKTYKNFKAHWGVVPKSILDTQPTFLGAYDGTIEINTVAATTNNDTTDLGELGGNGVGVVSGHKVHFKSSGFGVIILTFYIEKPSEYDSFGINRFNQILDVWDLPYPEFANISLVPVDSYSLNMYGDNHDILGYLPRFFEHKTDIDSVHGEFYNSSPLSSIKGDSMLISDDDPRGGVFSQYVTPRHSYGSADDISFLYISPSSVDNIFVSASDGLQSSDQFKINCNIDCKAVLPLSVVGLPL